MEQQAIGNVLPPVSGEVLLAQTGRPPEMRKDRPYQIVFSLAFIGRTGDGEAIENTPNGDLKGGDRIVPDFPPVVETSDRIAKEFIGEETSLKRTVTAHAFSVLESGLRFSIAP